MQKWEKNSKMRQGQTWPYLKAKNMTKTDKGEEKRRRRRRGGGGGKRRKKEGEKKRKCMDCNDFVWNLLGTFVWILVWGFGIPLFV